MNKNNKKDVGAAQDRVSSREAVERAIERSKVGPGSVWEKSVTITKWGQKRPERRPAANERTFVK
jgi:hypothetical protein